MDEFIDIYFFSQAEDGIRDFHVTGVQTCALPISPPAEGENTGRTLPRPSKCRGPPGCAFPPPPGSPAGKGWILRSPRTLFRTGEGYIRKNNGAPIRGRKCARDPAKARSDTRSRAGRDRDFPARSARSSRTIPPVSPSRIAPSIFRHIGVPTNRRQ